MNFLFNLLTAGAEGGANAGTGTEEAAKGNSLGSIIIMIVLAVAIVGLFIWSSISNKKKRKQAQEKMDSLRKGDRVKTIGGVCGFIVEINNEENTFVMETGSKEHKCYLKFDKGAIYQTSHVGEDNKETPIEVKEEPKAEVKEEVKAEETSENK